MQTVIDLLHSKHLIWQGSKPQHSVETLSTGYKELDTQLDGGLPCHGVVEISSDLGIGELRLLTPYIKTNSKQRLSVFINSPGHLCSEYLTQQDIDIHRVIMIFPKTEKEALWSAEQCLKSGCCGSVTLWHPSLEVHQARRLQVASETGQCLMFLFKTEQKHQVSLPISLSIQLQPEENGIKVALHKRKGGWLKSSFSVDMGHRWPYLVQKQRSTFTTNDFNHQDPINNHDNVAHFPPLKQG
ncbi:translesion DNA synthesis-associated protein ImuA [Vibrio algarum]|uniref:Translesion DNA synthesis-associated protein ImuA n=1 Tax=Vibrio algarum TaxID=3020714 RepID=A0ABT4YS54_9VIBR|nr:translesion DNA synthesis-associated protein ImuA [Vibrio sp. KJ40-1]MDB1124391.1 translesion DNA synthesis-associated protein ImuA [Vibrio sp. KJ40-1]